MRARSFASTTPLSSTAPDVIHLVATTASTNALALASDGMHGEAWLADEQTAGRGRREIGGTRRAWFSPAGHNVYLSVLLRPPAGTSAVSAVTLAAGAAVCDALATATNFDGQLWLKWPNDLWVANAKLAGILTEARSTGSRVEAVVVGIGVNVNLAATDFPAELREVATSLQIVSGVTQDRLAIALRVRDAIVDAADAFFAAGWDAVGPSVSRWDQSAGRPVEVEIEGAWRVGTAVGIERGGGLAVAVDGERMVVTSGEVRFLR